ncbi:hypothetical protein ACQJBY_041564 [Aegilops geniculata]
MATSSHALRQRKTYSKITVATDLTNGEGARPGEEGSGEGPEDLGSLLLDLDLGPGIAAAACSFWETRTLLGAPGSLLLETPLDHCCWRRGPGPGSAEEK